MYRIIRSVAFGSLPIANSRKKRCVPQPGRSNVIAGKYSKDYRIQHILNEQGKLTSVAEYVGPRYRYAAPPEKLRRDGAVLTAAVALSAAALLLPLCVVAPVLRMWYVMLPLALALAPMALLVQWCVRFHLRRGDVTREQKDQLTERLPPWSGLQAMLALWSLIGQLVYAVYGVGLLNVPVLLATVLLLCMSVLLFARRHSVDMVESVPARALPEDGGAGEGAPDAEDDGPSQGP